MFDIIAALQGIISSVPEAIALFEQLKTVIAPADNVPETTLNELAAAVPLAHAAVTEVHDALAVIVAAHSAV
jgi:hypothetical protein